MPNRRFPRFTLSFVSSACGELRWLAPLAFSIGVFESVLLVPLNLAVPRLGQGAETWGAPRAAAFFLSFALILFALFGIERRMPDERRSRWCDSLSMAGPAALMAVGMAGMLVFRLGGLAAAGFAGAVAQGAGAGACLVAVMARLKNLRPLMAANALGLGLVVSTAVMLMAGSTGSPWFLAVHMLLVGLACLGWRTGLKRMPGDVCVAEPISEVWGQYEPRHTLTAVIQFAMFGLYGLMSIAAAGMSAARDAPATIRVDSDSAVTLAGSLIYIVALAALMGFYGSRHSMSVTRSARMLLCVTGTAAFCIAFVPQLTLVAESAAMSAQVFWVQTFLIMALPIMRSGVRPVGETVALPNACMALAAAFVTLFGRSLLEAVGVVEALFGATVLAMLVLSCCIQQIEPNFASSQQTGPQFLDELTPKDAVRFGPAIMRYGLTAREADLLPLLASGMPATAMAEKLCISLPTVNTHVRHIYTKMDVHSREELMAKLGARGA